MQSLNDYGGNFTSFHIRERVLDSIDVGAGSDPSLAALRGYPLDLVKIDRPFIADAARDPEGARFLGAVLGVIHAAGRRAVAEGIESREQLRLLKRMGCDLGQGYLFSEPRPIDDIAALLTSWNAAASG